MGARWAHRWGSNIPSPRPRGPLGLYLCTISPLFQPPWVQHPSPEAPRLCRSHLTSPNLRFLICLMGNGSTGPLPA